MPVSLKVVELPIPVVTPFSGNTSRHPSTPPSADNSTDSTKKAEQNAAPRKAQHAQRADLARAPRDRRIHRIHRRETAAHGHDDRYENADEFDRGGRCRLRRVILSSGIGGHIEALVALDVFDQRVGRDRRRWRAPAPSSARPSAGSRSSIWLRSPKISLFVALCPAVHDADDVPIAAAEMQLAGRAALRETASRSRSPTTTSRLPALNQRPAINL